MNLAVIPVSEVDSVIDHDGIPLVRKAIIRYGLALSTSVCWEITKLFQHLLDIILRCSMEFAEYAVESKNFLNCNTQLLLSIWTLTQEFSVLYCIGLLMVILDENGNLIEILIKIKIRTISGLFCRLLQENAGNRSN